MTLLVRVINRSDSFKSISSAFRDPLRQSAEPWCFSLMLSVPHRVGVGQGRSEGAAGASTIQIFMFTASRHKTKQNNRQRHASPPHPARWRVLLWACLSGRHVWNNFYHTSHQMFSHFSNGHFYQEWKLPHVAWKPRSLKRATARGFLVPLRTWSSLKAFSGLSIQLPGKWVSKQASHGPLSLSFS